MSEGGCIGAKPKKVESPRIEDTPSTQFEDSESMNTPMTQKESPTEESKKEIRYGQDEGDEDREAWLAKKESQFAQRQYDE